jgi:uncharacterized membrane protein (TIGR02234 family)
MPEPRRTFGPTLLLGLSAGTLCAVASSRPWVEVEGDADLLVAATEGAGEMPLAAALSLVVLAAWGVLLVTRGRVRRVLAVVAALAALGVIATVVTAAFTLPDDLRDDLARSGGGDAGVGFTGWYWTAAAAAVVSLAATVVAVRHARAWPEMGSRYDAPGGRQDDSREAGQRSNLDLWKSLDEGEDPTT